MTCPGWARPQGPSVIFQPPIGWTSPAGLSSLNLGCCHFYTSGLSLESFSCPTLHFCQSISFLHIPKVHFLPFPRMSPALSALQSFPSRSPISVLIDNVCNIFLFVGCQWETIILGQNNTQTSNQTLKDCLHLAPSRIYVFILPSRHSFPQANLKDPMFSLCPCTSLALGFCLYCSLVLDILPSTSLSVPFWIPSSPSLVTLLVHMCLHARERGRIYRYGFTRARL